MTELELLAAIAAGAGALAAFIKAIQYIFRWIIPKVHSMFRRLVDYDSLDRDIRSIEERQEQLIHGVTAVLAEVKPNGGASLRDAINRIEARQIVLDGSTQVMMHEHTHAVFKTDKNGLWTWVNRKYGRIAGTSLEEVKGTGWVNGIHPDDRIIVEEEWHRAINENRAFNMNYRMISPTGIISPVTCSSYRLEDPDGKTVGYVGIIARDTRSTGA